MHFKRLVLILVSFACCAQESTKKAIILDIGNVLVGPAKIESFKAAFTVAGAEPFVSYFANNPAMIHGSTEKMRCQLIYPFLRNCLPYDQGYALYDELGQRMPQMMVAWLTGHMNCQRLRAICQEKAALYSSWFASQSERDLVRALTTVMFTPHYLVRTQKLLQKSVDFVYACKKAGYHMYILSNWDAESFPELIKKDPSFFALFDGIVTSGACGYAKPDQKIYEHILRTYQLEATNCFFIDDLMQNVEAAQAVGITAAQCLRCDIETIKPAFERWANSLPK